MLFCLVNWMTIVMRSYNSIIAAVVYYKWMTLLLNAADTEKRMKDQTADNRKY